MIESAYVSDLRKEAVYMYVEMKIKEQYRVSPSDCWIEKEDGMKVGTTTLIKKLLQENHGTIDHPLILVVPPQPEGPPTAYLFDAVLRHKTDMLKRLDLTEDHNTTSILKGLQTAKVFNIPACSEQESLVRGVTVSGVEFDKYSIQPSTIYIREFYPTLLNCLLKNKYTILLGNPGISKSWFHWYILYHMVNENVACKFEAPKLIVRQLGERRLVFIFPQYCKVFYTRSVNIGYDFLIDDIQPDAALLLIEPEASLKEPIPTGIQTILTCSPDRRRYHEFQKKGAAKYIMPVWKLDELQLVAAHIRGNTSDKFLERASTSEGIEERYRRFGGIIRYVIPSNEQALEDAKSSQEMVLANTKAVNTFIRGVDIEKRDDRKENISHFLLHYKVDEETFRGFEMMIASEYVQKKLDVQHPSDAELHGCIHELVLMFRGGKPKIPILFEFVVYHMLVKSSFKWKICKGGKGWKDCDFKFSSGEIVAKYDEEVLKKMQTGILYRPIDPYFPAVDMLWVEKNGSGQRMYYGIQITFAESHAKGKTVYEKLYDRLGLNKTDKFNIYMITNPCYTETYVMHEKEQYFNPQFKPSDKFLYNIEFATISTKEFDKL